MPRVAPGPFEEVEKSKEERKSRRDAAQQRYDEDIEGARRRERQREIDKRSKTPPILPEGHEGPPETARFEEDVRQAAEDFPLKFKNASRSNYNLRSYADAAEMYTNGVFTFDIDAMKPGSAAEGPSTLDKVDEFMLKEQRKNMGMLEEEEAHPERRGMKKPSKLVNMCIIPSDQPSASTGSDPFADPTSIVDAAPEPYCPEHNPEYSSSSEGERARVQESRVCTIS